MEKFAKLFEFHGRQILVKKGKDSEDNPKLCIITQIEGAEVDFGLSFSDTDAGWDSLNASFDKDAEIEAVARGFAEQIKDCKTALDVMGALK